jgi:phage head maturation protease
VRCVITTVDPDRSGDVVVPTGVKNLEEYLLNPVVLWAHDRFRVPPIGTCAWVDVQPRRIVAETRFAQGIAFAEDVFKLYDRGVLRGWSIGFVPRKAHRTARPCTSANGTCSNTRPCRSPRTPGP